jgi:CO dehydrogenase nickel-insertion accessory protein CooC1
MTGIRVPIISFASTKGGVGKTTLAFVVATAIARRLASASDYCVACIDADPNLDFSCFPTIAAVGNSVNPINYLWRGRGNKPEGQKTDCLLPVGNRLPGAD